jgi:ubiquinol-cytochrome c reductase iron-sulfur subunit
MLSSLDGLAKRTDLTFMSGLSWRLGAHDPTHNPTGVVQNQKSSPSRRNFLYLTTAAVGVMGAASIAWPFVDQMNPSADVLAAGSAIDIDISKIGVGQQILIGWRGRPIFIAHRTADQLRNLRDPKLLTQLRDPGSEAHQQPSYVRNWSRSIKPEYVVLVGICTHLGCIPKFRPDAGAADIGKDWPGGWFCPCHGSKYDFAGRVFQGVPAPFNLPVPPYHYPSGKTVRIGENPEGQKFSLSSVEQI